MRLINLGLPKSGTTTLHNALTRAGLKSAHWALENAQGNYDTQSLGNYIGYRIYRDYLAGLDPFADLTEFDALTQMDMVSDSYSFWPQFDHALLQEVRRRHPDCLFVLLTRDPAKLLKSLDHWYDLRRRIALRGAPGLPAPFAQDDAAVMNWISGHFENVRTWFWDDPLFLDVDLDDPLTPATLAKAIGVPSLNWERQNTTIEQNSERNWSL